MASLFTCVHWDLSDVVTCGTWFSCVDGQIDVLRKIMWEHADVI